MAWFIDYSVNMRLLKRFC